LHYDAVKSLLTPWLQQSIHYIPKYITSVFTKSPFHVENSKYFLARTRTKNTVHQNTPFQMKIAFFSGRGGLSPFPVGKGVPPHTPPLVPPPSFLDPPVCYPRILARFTSLRLPIVWRAWQRQTNDVMRRHSNAAAAAAVAWVLTYRALVAMTSFADVSATDQSDRRIHRRCDACPAARDALEPARWLGPGWPAAHT